MSETHPNAYKLELAEKKRQLTALQGDVDKLQGLVDAQEPEGTPVEETQVELAEEEVEETASDQLEQPDEERHEELVDGQPEEVSE